MDFVPIDDFIPIEVQCEHGTRNENKMMVINSSIKRPEQTQNVVIHHFFCLLLTITGVTHGN